MLQAEEAVHPQDNDDPHRAHCLAPPCSALGLGAKLICESFFSFTALVNLQAEEAVYPQDDDDSHCAHPADQAGDQQQGRC
jgi:hypothetical protein